MQADVLESQPKYFGKRQYRNYNKYQGKPPQAAALGILGAPPAEEAKPKWEDKWTTLRAQRCAKVYAWSVARNGAGIINAQRKCPYIS